MAISPRMQKKLDAAKVEHSAAYDALKMSPLDPVKIEAARKAEQVYNAILGACMVEERRS